MLALATRLLQRATDEKLFPRGIKRLVQEALLEDVFLCLLEYHNHDPWFGVHPLVRPLLEV